MSRIKVGGKFVGKNEPVLIVAEAGINHDGNYEQAIKLIDIASECGADVVKFQLFKTSKMYTKKAGEYTTAAGSRESITKLLKSVELPYEWIPKLIDYCNFKNIGFLCTVCDEESGEILDNFGVDAFKLASYAITHIPLLKHVARKNKPIVFSSAGATLAEVDEAIRIIKNEENHKIALMHCIAKYPAPLQSCNMNILDTFKNAFPDVIIGYSDHTEHPTKAPVTAVLKGAKIVEKHFTLDKTLHGADHCFAVGPDGLIEMVKAIRETEKKIINKQVVEIDPIILGTSEKKVLDIEQHLRRYAYRCVFAISDIREGEEISISNSAILRPGESERGIDPAFYEIILFNKVKANKKINAGDPIKWEDLFNI
jgi:N-acetylneuraminate synthase